MTSQSMPRPVGAALTVELEFMDGVGDTDGVDTDGSCKLAGSRHLTSGRGIRPMKEVNV